MTDVRTFRAENMQAALDIVRREMGGEAVILHTRQFAERRWVPWRQRQVVEITAGVGVNVRTPPVGRRETAALNSTGGASTAGIPGRAVLSARPVRPSASSPGRLDLTTPDLCDSDETEPLRALHAERLPKRPRDPAAPLLARVVARGGVETERATGSAAALDEHATSGVAGQLESIRRVLESFGSRAPAGAAEIPAELFGLYTELIDADVEDRLAHDLILDLKRNATPEQLQYAPAARTLLAAMVEADFQACGPIVSTPGRRKVVALVGATGVGKTTTIAKLAANFRLREGVRMGLVTVDTFRIAAVEQLRTYAEIIDLPMRVVTGPAEMRRAMDELADMDLVLIDTGGRSPRDELQIQELKRLLAEAQVDEVHLVLSLTASLRSLRATVEKFAAVKTTALLLTKLDEAAGLGPLLSLAREVKLPISYVTTGQDVPDDIEPAHPARLSRLVLGRERIG
ncbi:MAG: flagellar biosynthesis protein FlhF [Planctomycetes bacterium]|nr:flagellar biosynthesis protein FlhF [Planctomycetota bacterium]